ncbi:capsid assembly scaffolding protein Gp46 family protein [Enterococcus gallinarum]
MIAAETKKAVTAAEEKWRAEKDEAAKLAEMDDKEKADYEKQQLEAKLAEYERKEVLSKMSEQASEMLSEKGATPTKEMLRLIVSEDAETTSNNVKTYLASVEAEREAIKAEYEKRLGGKVPLDGNSATLSRGAQLAKEANNQTKKPENDPWAIK